MSSVRGLDHARRLSVHAKSSDIPELPLYAQGYTSIGCAPCTAKPIDPNDPRPDAGPVTTKLSAGSISSGRDRSSGTLNSSMEYFLGFVIAVFIGLTGVGAGSMTTPLLILLLGMPTSQAVGTALIFGAAVKIITTPFYAKRRQIDWKAFGYLLSTGLPGVLVGSLLLSGIKSDWVTAFVGVTIVCISTLNLLRFGQVTRNDRKPWLAAVGLPIGLEVGFSSAGAGALGALCLMNMTTLAPAAVVGTDLSLTGLVAGRGSIRAGTGDLDKAVLTAVDWRYRRNYRFFASAEDAVAEIEVLSSCLALVGLGGNLAWKGISTAMGWH